MIADALALHNKTGDAHPAAQPGDPVGDAQERRRRASRRQQARGAVGANRLGRLQVLAPSRALRVSGSFLPARISGNGRFHPSPPAASGARHAGRWRSSPSCCSSTSATRCRRCSGRTRRPRSARGCAPISASTSRSIVQFGHFLGNALQGEFGLSLRQGRTVSTLIKERLPATLELAFAAALIALVVGIPMGVYTALRRRLLVLAVPARGLAGRRVAADLPDRHPADPGVRGAARLAAVVRPRRDRAARLVEHRLADRRRAGSTDPAGDHAVVCSS